MGQTMSGSLISGSRAKPRTSILVVAALVLIQIIWFPQPAEAATTGSAVETGNLVKQIDFNPEPIDPSGIAYMGSGKLMISDSEINEVSPPNNYKNIWRMSTSGAIDQSGKIDESPVEPTGLAYNSSGGRLYVSNDAAPWIQDIRPGADGRFGTADDQSTFLNTASFGVTDTEDVAWDGSRVYIAGGTQNTITPVSPGPNGKLGDSDDVVSAKLNLSAFTDNIEGLGYRAVSDTLLVVDPTGGDAYEGAETIFEITKTGRLIRAIRINFTETPSDVAVAPATVGGGNNLFVVDRGEDSVDPDANNKDGRMYEVSTAFANLAPYVDAGPNKSVPINLALTLTGDSYDDGQPTKNGVTYSWTKVSGPGNVNFTASTKLSTGVTFTKQGSYVLKLTADDGPLANSDTVTVTVTEPDFFDDDNGHLFENDINWMAAQGITKGCGPRKFCPNDLVTRGQMAAFLVRALNLTAGSGANLFIDDNGHLFENDIDKLGTAGITRGCNPPVNNRFCPNEVVTRGQMAAFLVRALGYTDNGGGDLFIDDNGHLFENDIDKLGTAGVTRGCNPPVNDRFCPDLPVTRGAMAAFLHRALGD